MRVLPMKKKKTIKIKQREATKKKKKNAVGGAAIPPRTD